MNRLSRVSGARPRRRGSRLLNGIDPAGVERMTLQKPARGPTQPHKNTVPPDRLACIPGTGGLKSAGRWKQRRDPSLIQRDHTETELSHRRSDSDISKPSCRRADFHASRSTGGRARSDSRLGKTRRSRPSTNCCRTCLASSLKMRLALFRVTAPPRRLLTTIPTRVCGDPDAKETILKRGV